MIVKCPKCGSTNIFYRVKTDEYECLVPTCGFKWIKRKQLVVDDQTIVVTKAKLSELVPPEEVEKIWRVGVEVQVPYEELVPKEVEEEEEKTWLIREPRALVEVQGQVESSETVEKLTEESLLKKIKEFSALKGMAHITEDLGIETDYTGEIVNPEEQELIGKLVREGKIIVPKTGYLKSVPEETPEVESPTETPVEAPTEETKTEEEE